MILPQHIDARAFDALHDDAPAWREVMVSIARGHGSGPVEQIEDGTVLVARVGDEQMLKLYPPFLRDHFEFECAMLEALQGRLAVPTPRLVATGERDGWPYLVMTRLAGEPLTRTWPLMTEAQRLSLLSALGGLATQVHTLPVGRIAALAPHWPDFIATQRGRCAARQQRTGLPVQLQEALPQFLEGELPEGPPVLLTGEYTPMNLFSAGGRLAAMFDFGDGLVGPREYDWLGPLCFLAAGHAPRCTAFLAGCGARLDEALRLRLLRLLLLHRYSALPLQIACEGWQDAPDFESLAACIWPLA